MVVPAPAPVSCRVAALRERERERRGGGKGVTRGIHEDEGSGADAGAVPPLPTIWRKRVAKKDPSLSKEEEGTEGGSRALSR